MTEIFVCDDDVNVTEYLKAFITDTWGEDYKVVTMNRCQELIGMIELNERVPDILIMDINLQDGNGIETVKLLQSIHPKLKVIYLTGVIDYATEIFATNPSYFLVKPVNEAELCDAINKVSNELLNERRDDMIIKTNGSEILISRKDIMYVESHVRKLILYMEDGTVNEIYGKMEDFHEKLGAAFIRCHKSFLVNMKYIIERTNNDFCLSNGTVLPISKPNLKESKMKFISYLGEE